MNNEHPIIPLRPPTNTRNTNTRKKYGVLHYSYQIIAIINNETDLKHNEIPWEILIHQITSLHKINTFSAIIFT